jgi:hypothetical protein
MASYRAYRLNERRRIVSGDWLDALDDSEAKALAAELCEENGGPAVELWQATRLVAQIDCEELDG